MDALIWLGTFWTDYIRVLTSTWWLSVSHVEGTQSFFKVYDDKRSIYIITLWRTDACMKEVTDVARWLDD